MTFPRPKCSAEMMRILYQNVRGLRTKTTELKLSLTQQNEDVVCLTENWLNECFLDNEFCDGDLIVHRRDRNYGASCSTRGGGAIIMVKNHLLFERLLEARRRMGPY